MCNSSILEPTRARRSLSLPPVRASVPPPLGCDGRGGPPPLVPPRRSSERDGTRRNARARALSEDPSSEGLTAHHTAVCARRIARRVSSMHGHAQVHTHRSAPRVRDASCVVYYFTAPSSPPSRQSRAPPASRAARRPWRSSSRRWPWPWRRRRARPSPSTAQTPPRRADPPP